MFAIGVLTDRNDIYPDAIEYFKHGAGNGAISHVIWKPYPSVESNDEISQAASAFNHLVTRTAEVMTGVRDPVESVSTASKQIAAGNVDLSSRMEEQAASLEETAASMEQLTGTVGQNAKNAPRANGLAQSSTAPKRPNTGFGRP